MSQQPAGSMPHLDLAPKLTRPLRWWNLLDNLRLLYWIFFFPQALRWYFDIYGGGFIDPREINWRRGLELLRQNPIRRQLLSQVMLLAIVVSVLMNVMLQAMGFSINWRGVAGGVAAGVAVGVAGGVAVGVAGGMAAVVAAGVAVGVAVGVAAGVAAGVAILRPESWFLGWLIGRLTYRYRPILATTPIPLPRLLAQLKTWLEKDWEFGLQQANHLLAYTLQFIVVIKAVNESLVEIPGAQLVSRVALLAESPYDWSLVRFASTSLNDVLKSRFIDGLVISPSFVKRRLKARLDLDPRLNTPARAAAAGFWYLHEQEPAAAAEAFDRIRTLPHGDEMFALAHTLSVFQGAQDPSAIAALQVSTFPPDPLFRPRTWQALTRLRRVIEDVQMVQRSASRAARAFALNRALGELKTVLDHGDTLPEAERELILNLTQSWQDALLRIAGEVGEVAITQPVRNPYVIGDPVQGTSFVGREDVLRQLEELWVLGNQLQSVVLFGHRRMGKTSILLNIADTLGAGMHVAYVNLLRSANARHLSDVLMATSDEIADVMRLPGPSDAAMLTSPSRTFERYLKQVEAKLDQGEGLIIAIDEFEKIEELIETGRLSKDFMSWLRGLVQMSSKLAFAFAGLHTLEEMTADYFHPFFASVIPIRVGFLSPGAVRQLLVNSDEDFPLDYASEAFDEIGSLTAGQPYLTQLIGFQLVRRYNTQVFEQGRTREQVFGVADVEAVVRDAEFYNRGRYYFTGVWEQARREVPEQQPVLKALARHPAGVALATLTQETRLSEETLQHALDILKRHDVVSETEHGWAITVELFRRWVSEQVSE